MGPVFTGDRDRVLVTTKPYFIMREAGEFDVVEYRVFRIQLEIVQVE